MKIRNCRKDNFCEETLSHFRKLWVGLTILLGIVMLTPVAQAETCYRLAPFGDVLRLNVQINEGATGSAHHLVFGNWISGVYSLPVVGARELHHGSTSVRRLGIHGTNRGSFFGANPICALDGIPGSTWSAVCTAGAGARFAVSGTPLQPVSCVPLAPSTTDEGGSAAGQ